MSFKKSKGKKTSPSSRHVQSTSPPGTAVGSSMPEEAKAKLQELFGLIEHQFELMHTDNIACEQESVCVEECSAICSM